jgi:hypothetical protein
MGEVEGEGRESAVAVAVLVPVLHRRSSCE